MTWERSLDIRVVLDSIECCACGMPFAMPRDYMRHLREKGAAHWFYCPAGHQQHFSESVAERLRRELAAAERETANVRESLRIEAAAHRQTKAVARAAKRRAANGICPAPGCHRRPFDNLARHMATKHPDYVADVSRQAPTSAPPLVTWDYGTMRRVKVEGTRGRYYECLCGEQVATAHGKARRHARECKQASMPWPDQPKKVGST